MSGLTLWLPRTIATAEAITWLFIISVALATPGLFETSSLDGIHLWMLVFLVNVMAIWGIGLVHIVTSQLLFLRRGFGQKLQISPQSLQTRRHTLPLEDITHLELKRRVILAWWLRAHLSDGRTVLLAFDDNAVMLRHLMALIDEHRSARNTLLAAEGHDVATAAQPPAALEKLLTSR